MRLRQLLYVVVLLLIAKADDEYDEDAARIPHSEDDKLKANGKRFKVDGSTFVVRSGSKFKVSCVFQSEEIPDLHNIQWKNENGKPIDGESSSRHRRHRHRIRFPPPSVFTIALVEHRTGYKKRNLHFSAIDKRDEGTYMCEAKDLDGKLYQKKITIKVLAAVEWANSATSVGALVGEPLIINCDAVGNYEPAIQITDGSGEPLDEDLFTIAGNEVSIRQLSKEYQGKTISCIAFQILPEYDTTSSQQKDVKIEVWYRPEFEEERVDQYAIIGRHASLVCNVSSSNPPPSRYTFYKGNHELTDYSRHHLIQDVKNNYAILKILNVNVGDMGEYRCDVNNRKATGSQIINLKEANPPDEVKATLENTKKHSIVWRIETHEKEGELPIEHILIKYLRKEQFHKDGSNAIETAERLWTDMAIELKKEKNSQQLYEVPKLRPDTEYVFRFRARSAAGEGDIVEITATTAGDPVLRDEVSSSKTLFSFIPFLTTLYIFI